MKHATKRALLFFLCVNWALACKEKSNAAQRRMVEQSVLNNPQFKSGYIQTPQGERKIFYETVGNEAFYEGDLVAPLDSISSSSISEANPSFGLVGVQSVAFLWPNAQIPYMFSITESDFQRVKSSGDCPTDDWSSLDKYKAAVRKAMNDWETKPDGSPTGLRFYESNDLKDTPDIAKIGKIIALFNAPIIPPFAPILKFFVTAKI